MLVHNNCCQLFGFKTRHRRQDKSWRHGAHRETQSARGFRSFTVPHLAKVIGTKILFLLFWGGSIPLILYLNPPSTMIANILLMEEILHQLMAGKYPIIYRVLYIPGGAGFLPSIVWYQICGPFDFKSPGPKKAQRQPGWWYPSSSSCWASKSTSKSPLVHV